MILYKKYLKQKGLKVPKNFEYNSEKKVHKVSQREWNKKIVKKINIK